MVSRTPKVLHRLGGTPLLARVLDVASKVEAMEGVKSAPNQIVTVLKHEADAISQVLALPSSTVDVAIQSDVPGTGAGALAGVKALQDDITTVLVLSGDVPLIEPETLQALLDVHIADSNTATILTAKVSDPYGYGRILRNENGGAEDEGTNHADISYGDASVKGIVEEKDAAPAQREINEINSGIYAFDADFLRESLSTLAQKRESGELDNAQGELYLTDTIALAVQQGGRVGAYQTQDLHQVQGVNDRAQLAELARELNRRIADKHMRAGVTIMDPDSTWIEDNVTIEPDVVIEPNCFILGHTHILRGANILLGSRIIDAHISSGASVGPYAFLRPGANLQEDSKVGAFVEVKNSQIGARSKVPHLSYVGDAQIGEDSNVGAGSIFANYDGVKKHETKVGSRVKLGSKTVLVAPVTVGDDVYTGAATLLRKDVPSGALSYSKNDQVEVPDWVHTNR
jgi:bifunctional UDP-N-acetylglucosamine pyrophosphorylase/glucosamine-1-phosphate N-acetyltransferase